MINSFEYYWECFSDQLSGSLDDIAVSEHLSDETVDKVHLLVVELFLEHLDTILKNRAITMEYRSLIQH